MINNQKTFFKKIIETILLILSKIIFLLIIIFTFLPIITLFTRLYLKFQNGYLIELLKLSQRGCFNTFNNAGTYLIGLCGVAALFKIDEVQAEVQAAKLKREQERQEIAIREILREFKSIIIYISKIISYPDLYKDEQYYPNSIPETINFKAKNDGDWTRPIRLIENRKNEFEEKVNNNLYNLEIHTAENIRSIICELIEYIKEIQGYLQAQLGNHPDKNLILQQNFSKPEKYNQKLQQILQKAEEILKPHG